MKPITVKALIKSLKDVNPEAIVLLASDEEGNTYGCVPDKQFIGFEDTGKLDDTIIKSEFIILYPANTAMTPEEAVEDSKNWYKG